MTRSRVALAGLLALACSVAAGTVTPASDVSRNPAAQDNMTTDQLVILKRTPAFAAQAQTPEGRKTVQAHIQHLYARGADGTFKVAGPFADDGEAAGVIIVDAATPEKALEFESADPIVKAGFVTLEAISFMAPEGWFPGKWGPFGQFDQVFFGFLVNGPDRTQDQATAGRLQQEHLAYMDGQARDGRLVAAGPITTQGTRRGIVVYRAATLDEAKQRASADPMVKAGRLAVELHQWQVPVGSLPK